MVVRYKLSRVRGSMGAQIVVHAYTERYTIALKGEEKNISLTLLANIILFKNIINKNTLL